VQRSPTICCAKEPYKSKFSCAKEGLVCTGYLTLCAKEPSLLVQRRICCAKKPYKSKISCANEGLVCTGALTLCAKEPSLLCKGGSIVQRSPSKDHIKRAYQWSPLNASSPVQRRVLGVEELSPFVQKRVLCAQEPLKSKVSGV